MKRENNNDKDTLDTIDKFVTELDEQRLVELENLKQVQEIKNEMLLVEKNRLMNKYGADYPRVQKMEARLESNQSMFSGLDIETERAKTKTEPLPNNSWRVHGKAFDLKKEPLINETIFLTDEKRNWIKELGSVCTNKTGYYSITIDEKLIGAVAKRPLYLSVSDKNQQLIYQDQDPFLASKGLIDYRDIYLDGKECIPPATDNGKGRSSAK